MWPPKSGLGTPTVPYEASVFSIHGTCTIAAPASVVFRVLRNAKRYEWNSFCPSVDIESQPKDVPAQDADLLNVGTIFIFPVIMDEKKPDKKTDTRLIISDLSTPEKPSEYVPADMRAKGGVFTEDLSKVYRISWKGEGGFAAKGLKSERFHEVIVLGENECEVRTWEVMGGVLAHTVKWFYKSTLQKKFELWCSDLKRKFEKEYANGGIGAGTATPTAAAPVPS